MPMSTKRLGFKFNRNDELLSEVQEGDINDSCVQNRGSDSPSHNEGSYLKGHNHNSQ